MSTAWDNHLLRIEEAMKQAERRIPKENKDPENFPLRPDGKKRISKTPNQKLGLHR